MKSPKGFGKLYFTFASILAHSTQNTMHSLTIKADYLFSNNFTKEANESDESDPPSDLLATICIISKKPCHCNSFYKLKAYLSLKINHFIPRCSYYNKYFAFRRTGIHPPYLTLTPK